MGDIKLELSRALVVFLGDFELVSRMASSQYQPAGQCSVADEASIPTVAR